MKRIGFLLFILVNLAYSQQEDFIYYQKSGRFTLPMVRLYSTSRPKPDLLFI